MSAQLQSVADFKAFLRELPRADAQALAAAYAHDAQLTKPQGSLGRLEEVAAWMASWQGRALPTAHRPQVVIFAANHGVTAQGVSAFPPEVTGQMVANFGAGGAAINQLCGCFGASLNVIALALDHPTADFTQSPAMSAAELLDALRTGWEAVDREADVFVTGEMGIGNTTSAAAIVAALLGGGAQAWIGRGTGVDDAGLARKRAVVTQGLERHAAALSDPLEVLRCLGGREIAAMAGAIARARSLRIPVVLDGFICCAAALVLQKLSPDALDHCIAGHQSAESAHGRVLVELGKEPLLTLGMRLGEGSGGALALGVIKGAVACHSTMATFSQAGVSSAS